jgi:hypothetical protein
VLGKPVAGRRAAPRVAEQLGYRCTTARSQHAWVPAHTWVAKLFTRYGTEQREE